MNMKTTKRRKAWWHLLRGPRGHRGLPGPIGPVADDEWKMAVTSALSKLETRIVDLERKLGGSQK